MAFPARQALVPLGTDQLGELLLQEHLNRGSDRHAEVGSKVLSDLLLREGPKIGNVYHLGCSFTSCQGGDVFVGLREGASLFRFCRSATIYTEYGTEPGFDEGIWRRIHLVPFNVRISAEECDPDLGSKLQMELPGILGWAVEGCLAWQRDGLLPPQVLRDAVVEYRAEMDSVALFLAERTEPGSDTDRVGSKTLHESYKSWCSVHDRTPMASNEFRNSLLARGIAEARVGENRGRGWKGLRLHDAVGMALQLAA